MSIIGKWIGENIAEFPQQNQPFESVPSTVFPTQVRNDASVFNKVGSTITLDANNDADGYIIRASIDYIATHNNRFTPNIRVVPTVNAQNADVLDSIAGGYSRQTSDNKTSTDSFTVVTNIIGSVTFQVEWRAEGTATIAGSIDRACLEIIPIYFDGIGLYEGTQNALLGSTTPSTQELNTTIVQSGGIQRTGNTVTLNAQKRFLVLGCYFTDRSGVRTQRWSGIAQDGIFLRDAMVNTYIRDSNNGKQGEVFTTLIETGVNTSDIELQVYLGDGIDPPSLGGAGFPSSIPTVTLASLAVIELKSGCEVFKSYDDLGGQDLGGAGDVVVNSARNNIFNNANSFIPVDDSNYKSVLNMDGFFGANISASYQTASGTRLTRRLSISVNGVEDRTVSSTKFGRGSQGGQVTYGFSGNPFGFVNLKANDNIGVICKDVGNNVNVSTRAGWAGMWGINLDTMNNGVDPRPDRRFFSIA